MSATKLARAGYTAPPADDLRSYLQLPDYPKGTGRGGCEVMFIYGEAGARGGTALEERALAAFRATPS